MPFPCWLSIIFRRIPPKTNPWRKGWNAIPEAEDLRMTLFGLFRFRRENKFAIKQILIQRIYRPCGMHIVSIDDSVGFIPSPSSKLIRRYAPSEFFCSHRIHNKPDILLEEQRKAFQQLAGQFFVAVLENTQ